MAHGSLKVATSVTSNGESWATDVAARQSKTIRLTNRCMDVLLY
jgi:hypothetical protein